MFWGFVDLWELCPTNAFAELSAVFFPPQEKIKYKIRRRGKCLTHVSTHGWNLPPHVGAASHRCSSLFRPDLFSLQMTRLLRDKKTLEVLDNLSYFSG